MAAAFGGAAAVLSLAAAAAAAAISFCLGLGGGFGGCLGINFGSTTVSEPLDSVVDSLFLGTWRTEVVILGITGWLPGAKSLGIAPSFGFGFA